MKRVTRASNDADYLRLKRDYKESRRFKDCEKESGPFQDFIDELESKGIDHEVYYDKSGNGCTVFYDDYKGLYSSTTRY